MAIGNIERGRGAELRYPEDQFGHTRKRPFARQSKCYVAWTPYPATLFLKSNHPEKLHSHATCVKGVKCRGSRSGQPATTDLSNSVSRKAHLQEQSTVDPKSCFREPTGPSHHACRQHQSTVTDGSTKARLLYNFPSLMFPSGQRSCYFGQKMAPSQTLHSILKS